MFDNAPEPGTCTPSWRCSREATEDARIALRCNRKELQLVDSFVTTASYPLGAHEGSAARVPPRPYLSTAPTPAVDAEGFIEVPVRLRPEEYAAFETRTRIANGPQYRDILAEESSAAANWS